MTGWNVILNEVKDLWPKNHQKDPSLTLRMTGKTFRMTGKTFGMTSENKL